MVFPVEFIYKELCLYKEVWFTIEAVVMEIAFIIINYPPGTCIKV